MSKKYKKNSIKKKTVNKKTKKQCLTKNIGKKVPNVIFRTRIRDQKIKGVNKFRWKNIKSKQIFGKKRIVLLALPGAFTPTCSSTHLPSYEEHYDEIIKHDIDEIYVLSVNDAFVMYNWCKKMKIKKVKFLPDGNGDFTKKIGALVKKDNLGFGERSWRYSMVINKGKIEKIFSENGIMNNCPHDPFKVSDAKTMLRYLKTK
tara:strand:- start:2382 stop:2987 length:606 start_codon:yes stop_codon:yes gene_type:complete